MKPTEKSPQMESLLEGMSGRTTAITNDKCIDPPFGCGQPLGNVEAHFKDNLSLKEYRISGLCQTCQDKHFS